MLAKAPELTPQESERAHPGFYRKLPPLPLLPGEPP